MQTSTSPQKFLSRFGRDERGNFVLAFAAVASVLAMAAGVAVNTAQLSLTRSNLLQALDSAVTSTARDITIGTIKEADARGMVEAFLSANGGTGFASADTISLDTLTLEKATSRLSATASVDVELAFPLFTTASVQRVTVDSAALYSDKKIEVAMMLDITGSMSGQKIKDLKTAATNAVNAFLGNQDPADPRVRVAIVPYADAVNTGPLVRYVHNETAYTPGSSKPPVFDPLIFVANGENDMLASNGSTRPDRCATERKGSRQFTDASPFAAMVNRDVRLGFCPEAELQPLTADKASLIATIDDFKADGFTAGQIGVQWTRYMLSPKWADVLPHGAKPAAYSAKKTAKYAILMTDGEFNTAFAGVGRTRDVHHQGSLARTSAETHCAAMRKDGIEIFAVGFMLKESAAKAVMKNCASPDTSAIVHYYEVADGEALNEAFLAIAANIERLALTK
jgi:Flp pilus assembly protein TadG